MKTTSLVSFLLLLSCGSDSSLHNSTDLAGASNDLSGAVTDMRNTHDLSGSSSTDMAMQTFPADAGVSCGASSCFAPNVCCVTGGTGGVTAMCMASCPDGGTTVMCSGPEHCSGNPCCATVANRMFTGVSCTASMDACQAMFALSGSGKTRLCHTDADCQRGLTATQYMTAPNCCTFMQGGQTAHGCFDPNLVPFTMGAVTCP